MMFTFNSKNICLLVLVLAVLVFMPTDSYAAFESLKKAGQEIFQGLRSIIYPASAIGIICVCIGGFFGNVNWKWLFAIVIGLVVISCTVLFVETFSEEGAKDIPADIMGGK